MKKPEQEALNEGDFESLLDDFVDDDEDVKPEHAAWAEEFDADDD